MQYNNKVKSNRDINLKLEERTIEQDVMWCDVMWCIQYDYIYRKGVIHNDDDEDNEMIL